MEIYPMQKLKVVRTGHVCESSPRYTSPESVYSFVKHMGNLDREHFVVLHLNGKNQVIAQETVSIGSLKQSIVHPREVFKGAVLNSSAAIICVHNHPSGCPAPSPEDKSATALLKAASEIMGIGLLDHIIVGNNKYFSFVEGGLL
jgi:DNA repair protein RadC